MTLEEIKENGVTIRLYLAPNIFNLPDDEVHHAIRMETLDQFAQAWEAIGKVLPPEDSFWKGLWKKLAQ